MYVIVKFTEWNNNIPIGYVEQYIGNIGSFDNDIKYLTNVCDHDWNFKYNISKEPIYNNIFEIVDKFVISIDNEDTKDIDDAIHLSKKDNLYELGIHISDVNSYITTDIDDELIKRIETIYIENPKHMLGTEYSLIKDNIKNCISVLIYYNENGIERYEIKKTKVKISENTTYENFMTKLDDPKYNDIYEFGKKLSGYDKNYNIHKMIEIFMKIANSIVANELKKKKIGIFRTNPLELTNIKSDVPSNVIQKSQIIKMKRGNYSCIPSDYTHFSSPIRRYIDIIVHRLLFDSCNLSISKIMEIINITNYKHTLYRKCQREYQLLKILYNLPPKDLYEFDAYVIDIEFNQIIIYIEELDIITYYEIVSKKIIENIYMEYTKNEIIYDDLDGEHKISLFDKIKIQLIVLLKTNERYKIKIIF
jgi:exoribonuclease R